MRKKPVLKYVVSALSMLVSVVVVGKTRPCGEEFL